MAGFLGRRGKIAEALDLLDARAWKALPAEQVANTEVNLLYGAGTGDASLHDRVSRRIEGALRDRPGSISLRFDLANLRCLQGKYDEAESILRDIYERDKTQAAPLNNLAWMLAMRGGDGAEKGLKLIERAIELSGETPDLLDTRALVYAATNRVDLATRDLEEAVAVSPTADKYLHLARTYSMAARRGDAERSLREAKTRGLVMESLHPLEQQLYRQLLGELTTRQ